MVKNIIRSIIITILLILTLLLQGCLSDLVEKANNDKSNHKGDYYDTSVSYNTNSQEYSGANIPKQYSKNNFRSTVELYSVESELQTTEGEDDGELELMGYDEEAIECELSDLYEGEEVEGEIEGEIEREVEGGDTDTID